MAKVTEHPVVLRVAARLCITPAQLGLAWLLAHRPNVLLIAGTANAAHLQDNVAAASITLDATVLAELDSLSPPKNLYNMDTNYD
jgi:pyridoxine 4-dehydrogenase